LGSLLCLAPAHCGSPLRGNHQKAHQSL